MQIPPPLVMFVNVTYSRIHQSENVQEKHLLPSNEHCAATVANIIIGTVHEKSERERVDLASLLATSPHQMMYILELGYPILHA